MKFEKSHGTSLLIYWSARDDQLRGEKLLNQLIVSTRFSFNLKCSHMCRMIAEFVRPPATRDTRSTVNDTNLKFAAKVLISFAIILIDTAQLGKAGNYWHKSFEQGQRSFVFAQTWIEYNIWFKAFNNFISHFILPWVFRKNLFVCMSTTQSSLSGLLKSFNQRKHWLSS